MITPKNSYMYCLFVIILAIGGAVSATNTPEYQELLGCIQHADYVFNQEALEHLVARRPEVVFELNSSHKTLLYYAVMQARLSIVNFLIDKGANFNERFYNQETLLHIAIIRGDIDICILLIKKGVDVNAIDKSGWTPLLYAVAHSNINIVKLLIKEGADVNLEDKRGHTPLYVAVLERRLDLVDVLITAGANPAAVWQKGWVPLPDTIAPLDGSIAKLLINPSAAVKLNDNL